MSNKLSRSFVDSIPFPTEGQVFYRDSQLKGFGVRVGKTSKVYFAEGRVDRKTVRVTIGSHLIFTPELARADAKSILSVMANNIQPNEVQKTKKAKTITLFEVYQLYLVARSDLMPRTVYDYTRFMKTHFAEWNNKPITEITKDLVQNKHRQIGERSEAQANLAMRFLRALFNFAIVQYEDRAGNPAIVENPTKRLSQTRSWFRLASRQSVIKPHELPVWLKSVHMLPTISNGINKEAVKDYLLLLIFTGLRREEGLRLQWRDVDFEAKTLTIPDPKNGEFHTLPLSTFLYYLLKKRNSENIESSPFVFPGTGKKGYLDDPNKQMKIVIENSGVTFTPNDLRRTFITIAESMDVPAYTLKRLIRQKVGADAMAGYVIDDTESLRAPMQKIADYLMKVSLGLL